MREVDLDNSIICKNGINAGVSSQFMPFDITSFS